MEFCLDIGVLGEKLSVACSHEIMRLYSLGMPSLKGPQLAREIVEKRNLDTSILLRNDQQVKSFNTSEKFGCTVAIPGLATGPRNEISST